MAVSKKYVLLRKKRRLPKPSRYAHKTPARFFSFPLAIRQTTTKALGAQCRRRQRRCCDQHPF